MIKGIKIRLKPNNKEKVKLFELAEVARIKYKLFLNRLIGIQ
ncbi:helix-turn-helix domain-containing protein [Tissierella praeacuta]